MKIMFTMSQGDRKTERVAYIRAGECFLYEDQPMIKHSRAYVTSKFMIRGAIHYATNLHTGCIKEVCEAELCPMIDFIAVEETNDG